MSPEAVLYEDPDFAEVLKAEDAVRDAVVSYAARIHNCRSLRDQAQPDDKHFRDVLAFSEGEERRALGKLQAELKRLEEAKFRLHGIAEPVVSDVCIRLQVHDFAMSETASPWHRKCLTEMFDDWHHWNNRFFNGELDVPLILLAVPNTPSTFGDCGKVSAFGGAMQIRIRPSLLTGTHPMFSRDNYAGVTRAGRFEFVRDVLLHEMIHQWQFTTGKAEPSYSGHGPTFRDKCNEIGDVFGLPRVRTCKKRGPDKDLPSCSHWPHNVRPAGFYARKREAA